MFTNNELKKAKVAGIDENGNDVIYKLFNDFERFKEFEYEDFVPSLMLEQSNAEKSIKQNEIIGELKNVFASIAPSLK